MRALLVLFLMLSLVACDASPAASPGGLVVVGEPRVVSDPNLFRVDGRVKNNADKPYTGFVKVTLFDEGGKIVGVYTGAVNSVPPGEEVTYTAVGTDKPESWAKVEARIDSQVPG